MPRKLKLLLLLLSVVCLNRLFAYDISGGTVKGIITTSDGKPVADITVKIKENKQGTLSNEKGEFLLKNIKPGTYTLEISAVGVVPQQQTLVIQQNETVEKKFVVIVADQQLADITIASAYNKFAKKQTDGVARMPLSNLENPQVYNVVPKELLQDQVIISYNDVLKNVTGVSQALVNGSNSFNLRGFFTTSYLRNGLQDSKPNSIEVANIERIEVLKGPSATLFGSSLTSFGGLLNRITKQPLDTFAGEVAFTRGGFGLTRTTLDINTPLSTSKGLYLRTNAAYDDEGSFQDAGFTKRFFLAPSLLYKANERLTIWLDAEIYLQKANDFNRLFPELSFTKTNPRDLGINWKRSYSNNDLYETTPSISLYGKADYRLSDKWHSQTSFSQTNSSAEGYWSWNEIVDDSVVVRNPGYEHPMYNYTEVQQNFNGDFNIGNMRNRIVIGLDYFANTTKNSYASIYGYDSVLIKGNDPRYSEMSRTALDSALANTPYSNTSTTQSTYSAYVSDVLNLTNSLDVMASLRVDHFVNNGDQDLNQGTTTNKYNQTALSPKFGIVYKYFRVGFLCLATI